MQIHVIIYIELNRANVNKNTCANIVTIFYKILEKILSRMTSANILN